MIGRIAALACVALGACNAALSDHPLFAEKERSTTVVVEDGLWLLANPECPTDVARPIAEWPRCADWVTVRNSRITANSDTKGEDLPEDIFIVDGQPPLIQALIKPKSDRTVYAFLALEPKARSAAGKVTALAMWMVPCGTSTPGTTTVAPYPGFTEDCMPKDIAALRESARKGPADPDDIVEWRWVRATP